MFYNSRENGRYIIEKLSTLIDDHFDFPKKSPTADFFAVQSFPGRYRTVRLVLGCYRCHSFRTQRQLLS